jgi:hypothetical protein
MQEKPKFSGENILLGSGLFCAALAIALYFSEPKTDYNEAASVYFQYLSYTCFVGASVVRVINTDTPQISLLEYKMIQQKKEIVGFREGLTESEMPEYIKQIESYVCSFKLNQSGYIICHKKEVDGRITQIMFEVYRGVYGKYSLFKIEQTLPVKKVDSSFSDGEIADKLVDDIFPMIHIVSLPFTPSDKRQVEHQNAVEVQFDSLFRDEQSQGR